MFELRISKSAQKQLRKLKRIYKLAILSALNEIKEDPSLSKPLSRELTGKFTFHVSVYRIIYKVNPKDKIINILKIDHRSRVYQ